MQDFLSHLSSLSLGIDLYTIDWTDFIYLCIQGMLILPLSFTLLIIGPQHISASEVCLYSFIETILGPLWVWLGGYEAPPIYALYGGAVLLVVLGSNAVLSIREARKINAIEVAPHPHQELVDNSISIVPGDLH